MAVWSYCDGFVGRRDWGVAALEGLLLTNVALHWTALLLEAFGAHQTRFSLTVMTQNRVWRLLDRRFTP
jgi:hypothetical protein